MGARLHHALASRQIEDSGYHPDLAVHRHEWPTEARPSGPSLDR